MKVFFKGRGWVGRKVKTVCRGFEAMAELFSKIFSSEQIHFCIQFLPHQSALSPLCRGSWKS